MTTDDDLTAAYMLARKDADDEIKALRAENAQLREVLMSISCKDADCSCIGLFGTPVEHCVHGKARAALGEEK